MAKGLSPLPARHRGNDQRLWSSSGDSWLQVGRLPRAVVPCKINDDDLANKPEEFFTPGSGNGPFPGPGWEKWVGHDLSEWWMVDVPYEAVAIAVSENVNLSAWWITPEDSNGRTVIVTHGIGTSRRDYNTLLPAASLWSYSKN